MYGEEQSQATEAQGTEAGLCIHLFASLASISISMHGTQYDLMESEAEKQKRSEWLRGLVSIMCTGSGM